MIQLMPEINVGVMFFTILFLEIKMSRVTFFVKLFIVTYYYEN